MKCSTLCLGVEWLNAGVMMSGNSASKASYGLSAEIWPSSGTETSALLNGIDVSVDEARSAGYGRRREDRSDRGSRLLEEVG